VAEGTQTGAQKIAVGDGEQEGGKNSASTAGKGEHAILGAK